MPKIDLTDDELQMAAQAARIGAVRAEQDAERSAGSSGQPMFEAIAKRYRELAAKFEQAAKLSKPAR